MKTLVIDTMLKTFEGKEVRDQSGKSASLKDVIMSCLMAHSFKDKKKNIRAWMIGQKLWDATGEMNFEDADFDLIKEALEEMAGGAMVQGQVWALIEEAEKKGEDK